MSAEKAQDTFGGRLPSHSKPLSSPEPFLRRAKEEAAASALLATYGPPEALPTSVPGWLETIAGFETSMRVTGTDDRLRAELGEFGRIFRDINDVAERRKKRGNGGGSGGGDDGDGGDYTRFLTQLRNALVKLVDEIVEFCKDVSGPIAAAWKAFWEGAGREFVKISLAVLAAIFGLPAPTLT